MVKFQLSVQTGSLTHKRDTGLWWVQHHSEYHRLNFWNHYEILSHILSPENRLICADRTHVCRSSSLNWTYDWNRTEPDCKRPDCWLQLHLFWFFLVASCDVCWKNGKTEKTGQPVETSISSHQMLDLTHAHLCLIFSPWIIRTVKTWLRYGQKHFCTQFKCRSSLLLPYLS